jgi:predicted ATPase/DNA-binding SARP family transcriptional activator
MVIGSSCSARGQPDGSPALRDRRAAGWEAGGIAVEPRTALRRNRDVEFRILGSLEVRDRAGPIDVGGHRQRAVLARLLVDAGHGVAIDRLIDDVWEGDPPRSATKTLHKYISEIWAALRGAMARGEPSPIRTSGSSYIVDIGSCGFDAQRFEDEVADARRSRRSGDATKAAATLLDASSLWRGDVLADFPDSAFAVPLRARLGELRLVAIEERLDAEVGLGRYGECVAELVELVVQHPLREGLWALLMTALASAGQPAEALRAFRRYRWTLGHELGLEPSAELHQLDCRIARGEVAVMLPATARRSTPPTNLPTPLTTFIGRRQQLRDLAAELDELRLVTLTGPGGTGKSRLAIELSTNIHDRFRSGVWLIDVTPARSVADVVTVLADVVGVPADPDTNRDHLDVLTDALTHRPRTLLVIDNCEHLALECGELVARLLAACPELWVVATSRQPLHVVGEAVRPVAPLDVATEAALLFCDRAGLGRPDVGLDARDPTVLDICRRLDGLPLAIELAASTLQLVSLGELHEHVRRRPCSIERPPTVTRHRSLRAAMTWSYDLLSPAARALLPRLSIFCSSFDLDAAERVAGATRPTIDELVRMSLLTRQDGMTTMASRYRLLDTIRAFARELLEHSDEEEEVRARHMSSLLALAGAAAPNVLGPDELDCRRRLDGARHDIAAALAFATEREPSTGFDLAIAMWPHWLVWGRFREGLDQLTALLSVAGHVDPSRRAWASVAAADLAADAGDSSAAGTFAAMALAEFESAGDHHGQAYATRALANVAYNQGDGDAARSLLQVAAAHLEPIDDVIGRVHLRHLAGHIHILRGELQLAEQAFQDQLRWFEGIGSALASARSQWVLAQIAHRRGDDALARRLCEASLLHLRVLDDVTSIARVHQLLAEIAVCEGDLDRAAELFREAMEAAHEIGDQRTASGARDGLATIERRSTSHTHRGASRGEEVVGE